MTKNESLLTMMPPQAQKQVLLLIKRLGDQKQAKEQAQRQCIQYEAEISELKKQLEKLKRENLTFKAKWQHSFSAISKVRENFSGSKVNLEEESGKKKLRFNKDQGNWEEESEEEDESTHDQVRANNKPNLTSLQQQIKQSNHNPKPSPATYFSIQSPPLSNTIPTSRSSDQPHQPFTAKKPPRPHDSQEKTASLNKSKLNMTARSSKKLEIECLKQEIEQLTEEIRTKETGGMSLDDKIRRCEEIKNRYRKGAKGADNQEEMGLSQYKQANDSMMISRYHSPRKQHTGMGSNLTQQSYVKQLSSNHKPQQREADGQDKTDNNLTRIQSPLMPSYNLNQSNLLKQNIHSNTFFNENYSQMLNNSQDVSPVMMGQLAKGNNKQMGNMGIKKTSRRPGEQSFYDDGLLDLIAEMNP